MNLLDLKADFLGICPVIDCDQSEALYQDLRYPPDELRFPTSIASRAGCRVDFDYKPHVSFSMTHNNHPVILKYFVKEQAIQAKYPKINDPVHKDSCVELSIASDDDYIIKHH